MELFPFRKKCFDPIILGNKENVDVMDQESRQRRKTSFRLFVFLNRYFKKWVTESPSVSNAGTGTLTRSPAATASVCPTEGKGSTLFRAVRFNQHSSLVFFKFSIRVDSFLFTCHSVFFSFVVQIPLRNRFFFFCWNENENKRKQPAGKPTPRDGSASRFCCCWWRKKEWKRNYGDSEREKRGQRAEMTSPRSDPNGFFEKKKTSFDWKFAIISSKEIDKCPPDTIMGCAIEPWPTLDRHRRMNRS